MINKISILLLFAGIFFSWGTSQASITLGFDNISGNRLQDAEIGETQLFVDVAEVTENTVLFRFRNAGPNEYFISKVYFDDNNLLGTFTLIDSDEGDGDDGVDFSAVSNHKKQQSANKLNSSFVMTNGLSADNNSRKDTSVKSSGVDPGESLDFLLTLQNNLTYSKVIEDLADLDLRIRMNVLGFDSGKSKIFVNTPYDPTGAVSSSSAVPEPATFMLFGFGILGLAGAVRKKSRQQ